MTFWIKEREKLRTLGFKEVTPKAEDQWVAKTECPKCNQYRGNTKGFRNGKREYLAYYICTNCRHYYRL